ncbi:MAG: hypothetical protein ACOX8Q_05175 [Christensenellales bacterium]|jgi:hypothetical protein
MGDVRENRARRQAKRQGLIIKKSRAKKPNIDDLQGYMIIDAQTNLIVAGARFNFSLEEIEDYLNEGEAEMQKHAKK